MSKSSGRPQVGEPAPTELADEALKPVLAQGALNGLADLAVGRVMDEAELEWELSRSVGTGRPETL